MGQYAIAIRYVEALLRGVPTEELGRVQEEVCTAVDLWQTNTEFRTVMLNPFIPIADKQTAISRLAEHAKWHETLRRFFGVLLENGRISLLGMIGPVVAQFVRARLGREIAVIESPVPLSEDETQALAHQLGQRLGVTLIPQVEVKPELLGGIRIRVGDTMYDATVVGALHALSEELMKG